MTDTKTTPDEIKSKLALALDVDDLVAASRLAREMKPYFGVVKVGLELFSASGPEAIGTFIDLGYEVFLDVKLHDIPNTVGKAARVLGSLGVSYLTMHAHGGITMLRAGVEGLNEGASHAGLEAPVALGVTVLTSDDEAPDHIVPMRLRVAMEGGCNGIVCAASDLAIARGIGPRLFTVVPGIRPAGSDADDQKRTATPKEAIDAGANLLVIGRAVTAAEDRIAAVEGIVSELLG